MPVLWWVVEGDGASDAQGDEFGRIDGVVVEALAALAAVQAGDHHVLEQWGRGVALLVVLAEHDLGDPVGGVEPDQIDQRARAHRVATAELHRPVYLGHAGDAVLYGADA